MCLKYLQSLMKFRALVKEELRIQKSKTKGLTDRLTDRPVKNIIPLATLLPGV